MKVIAWILVIWIVGSIIYGIKNEGADSLMPIVHEYIYQLKNKPLITVVLTVIVVAILVVILF